ncbi:MAG TPA: metallophosphoesterase [Ignavibacteria bacterium]|jgi:hypothetical protein
MSSCFKGFEQCKGKLTAFAFLFLLMQFAYCQNPIRFAVIGDYGKAGPNELAVSNLVDSWNVDFIITVGDNNYEYGGASTIDTNIGYYYHEYIYPYLGIYGPGAPFNKFWPSLGNHDWDSLNGLAYYNYFTLPNNERYYDFIKGYVHFFVLDSDPREPDSIGSNSIQAGWLQTKLSQSSARFKIIYFHHPPYSSGSTHGNTPKLQWPFRQWGATCVLSGHEHNYERLYINSFTYFVNGLGGKSLYGFNTIIQPGSQVRYNANYGAQLVTSYSDSINFKLYNINGTLIDSYTIPYVPIGIIKTGNEIPRVFELYQNYPNPFNPSAKIRFEIPHLRGVGAEGRRGVSIKLIVYNILGKVVATLVNAQLVPGVYEVDFNAGSLSSGVYFYKLIAGAFTDTKRMVILK